MERWFANFNQHIDQVRYEATEAEIVWNEIFFEHIISSQTWHNQVWTMMIFTYVHQKNTLNLGTCVVNMKQLFKTCSHNATFKTVDALKLG